MKTTPNIWEADAPQQSSSIPTTETTQTNGEHTMYVQVCSCGFSCPIHGISEYERATQDTLALVEEKIEATRLDVRNYDFTRVAEYHADNDRLNRDLDIIRSLKDTTANK